MRHFVCNLMSVAALAAGLSALSALSGLPPPAWGQEPVFGNRLSVQEIIDRLSPERVIRGIGIGTGTPAEPPAQGPSLDFLVRFKFGSAELTPEAREVLDRLGEALQSERLQGYRFRIAGHTDAVGSDVYNQRLSQQRAEAVVVYLLEHFELLSSQFESVGYGKQQLLDAAHPNAAVNRRVEVINLGPA